MCWPLALTVDQEERAFIVVLAIGPTCGPEDFILDDFPFEPDSTISTVRCILQMTTLVHGARFIALVTWMTAWFICQGVNCHKHTLAGHSTMGDSRFPEPKTGMSLSGGQSLQAQISEEVLSALKHMKEENLLIRREMQQVINALTPHLSAASQTGLTSVSAPTPAQLNFKDSGVVFQRHLDFASTPIQPARQFAKQETDVHVMPWPFPSPPAADQEDDQLPPPPPPVSLLTPQGAAAQSSSQRLG